MDAEFHSAFDDLGEKIDGYREEVATLNANFVACREHHAVKGAQTRAALAPIPGLVSDVQSLKEARLEATATYRGGRKALAAVWALLTMLVVGGAWIVERFVLDRADRPANSAPAAPGTGARR
jgi:hypothetical protein